MSGSRYAAAVFLLLLTGSLPADDAVGYLRDIKPILKQHCYECHSGTNAESGLRLDTAAKVIEGGNTGPGLVSGNAAASLIIKRLTAADGLDLMPPKDEFPPLGKSQIQLIERWIDQGAAFPPDEQPGDHVDLASEHWAFQPVQRPAVSELRVLSDPWVRTQIDVLILAALGDVRPSPEADRVTLIRRLSLDLRGIPPSIAEVDRFQADARPGAYDRLLDRVLASPHYGERWGRHWLDQARYADSEGYTNDNARIIWKYRDWVIDAFNRDHPFDQFVIDQIAGDLRPGATTDQMVATGFHRNTQHNREGGSDAEQYRVERVADRVDTTGKVFLGITIGCARCHDHKYDPFSQRDFYRLFAFYNSDDEPELRVPLNERTAQLAESSGDDKEQAEQSLRDYDLANAARQADWEREVSTETVESEVVELIAIPVDQRTDEQREKVTAEFHRADPVRCKLSDHVEQSRKRYEELTTPTLVMRELSQPRHTHVHLRGNFLDKGRRVISQTPAVFRDATPDQMPSDAQPTRMDLALWLVHPKHPLTARVTVNRIWQRYFGTGIVETEDDFGTRGSPPSHPELLDWLATEFLQGDWSMKQMHRRITTSAAYRQSSDGRPDLQDSDPRNRLLARQNRLRLEAEVLRDAVLSASGLLSLKVGGPSVYPPQPRGVTTLTRKPDRKWGTSEGEDRYRRGLYTWFWRTSPHPFLVVFDAPDANAACTRRDRSNTPLQALMLLNDEAMMEAASALAMRVAKRPGDSDFERIRYAFRTCVSREPDEVESAELMALLAAERAAMRQDTGQPDHLAWNSVARVLLNLDEFITRE